MKTDCDVIQDLLPLYVDGICSEKSRQLVEEHLKTCAVCCAILEQTEQVPDMELPDALPPEDAGAVRAVKKVRRRWKQSLIAIVLVIPVLLMTVSQVMGMGICFTNLDDIHLAKKYVRCLQRGDMDKAAELYDFHRMYEEITDVVQWPETDYLTEYKPVHIGEEVFYVESELVPELEFIDDPDNIWGTIIYNSKWIPMLSVERWEAFLQENGFDQDVEMENGKSFAKAETPWGTYMVPDTWVSGFEDEEGAAQHVAGLFNVIPEDVFLSAEEELLASAHQQYLANQQRYGYVLDQTEEEFMQQRKEHYADELETAFRDVSISNVHFRDAFYHKEDGTWQNEISVRMERHGTVTDVRLIPFTKDGKIISISASY